MSENLKMLWSVGLIGLVWLYVQRNGVSHLMMAFNWLRGKAMVYARELYTIHLEVQRLKKMQKFRKDWNWIFRDRTWKSVRNITFLMLLMTAPLFATSQPDYYVGSSSAGANDGLSCASQHAISDLASSANWGSTSTKAGPDTTVHLCGTFTVSVSGTLLTLPGSGAASGTSGHPVTFKWETGATVTSAAMSIAFATNGNTFLIFDGNCARPCTPASITNTANGKSLANQVDSNGISAGSCDNCEIKNLTITNMFVQVEPATSGQGIGTAVVINGSNFSVHDCWITEGYIGVSIVLANGAANIDVYNNYFNHTNWGSYVTGAIATNSFSNVKWHGNTVGDMDNWDQPANDYHHNGVFIVQNNSAANISNTQIYNNLFSGKQGDNTTAWIFFNTGIHGMYVFNNVFNTNADSAGDVIRDVAGNGEDSDIVIVNNTIYCGGIEAFGLDHQYANTIIKNNAFPDACFTYIRNPLLGSGSLFDYNAYPSTITTASGHVMKVEDDSGQTWAAYRSAHTTFDANAILPSNFKLTAYIPDSDSTLIGAGVDLTATYCGSFPLICTDAAGNARPNGSAWTIGAYNTAGSGGGGSGAAILIATMALLLLTILAVGKPMPMPQSAERPTMMVKRS